MARHHFVADLHLRAEDTTTLARAVAYFDSLAGADAVYVLGDLFEYWVGDDQPLGALTSLVEALARLSASGTELVLMHGNRDFLVGEGFAAGVGARLERGDRLLIELDGIPTVLLHGDTLCTHDEAYQSLRREVRSAAWQRRFLDRPLDARLAFATDARRRSDADTHVKDGRTTDVSPEAVEQLLQETGASLIVHGHTHRPAEHWSRLDGRWIRRLVVGDWHPHGGIVAASEPGRCALEPAAGA